MTDPLPINGRVSQRDLYEAINRLDAKLDGHYHKLDERLRRVEVAVIEDQAHDDERALMLRQQADIRQEQGVSRRFQVTTFVTVLAAFSANAIALLALLR